MQLIGLIFFQCCESFDCQEMDVGVWKLSDIVLFGKLLDFVGNNYIFGVGGYGRNE